MSFKAAIFDLGGTLVDDRDMVYKAHAAVLGELDAEPEAKEDFDKNFTSNWVELYEKRGLRIDPKQVIQKFERFTLEKNVLGSVKLYSGTLEALQRIKSRMHIALNTSYRKKEVDAMLGVVRLPHFDAISTGDDLARLKPNPRPINEICKTLRVLPEQCVMVGDTSADILCGKNAGSKTIAVTWGTNYEKDLARLNPDLVAYSWKNVIDFLGV